MKETFKFVKPIYEFHVSRNARDFYHFDESLFAQTGNVIFINFYMVRLFTDRMNKKRNLSSYPELTIKAGQMNAMGLIDEILHYLVGVYKEQNKASLLHEAYQWLGQKVGKNELRITLEKFIEYFPPLEVYKHNISPSEYLAQSTAGVSNVEIALEELMLFHLANTNPAFEPFRELFDDSELAKETSYRDVITILDDFFVTQPVFGPENQILIEMLRTPAKRHPHSLTEQLEFMRKNWAHLISKYISRLLGSLDLIKEEEKPAFEGPGPSVLIDYSKLLLDEEGERFSADLDWMPNVVMIAKSTYVWLDQLSKKYQRHLHKLDHIPDEELDILAQRGFNALWLIGIWERSPASQKIKQMCGNPEAVSSAYSLYDYIIANDLGGDSAFENLRTRAWKRGIRVASDMVPNHTGIYSKWVIEHPHWYIQSGHPVYPSYSFNGANLSHDDRVGIYIEDGYWSRSDAAVLFKRVDHYTGDVRYIYHGNDGTSMPWNDTAQLNYLIPEVREAVIQTIIHVARKFPIIRLDAAMTLTKRHFQRLWFPQPGSGGDIPSRAEFGLIREQFNELFPVEFWREVVDRIAQEVPDTLLLAEAFWMMEGYFVRTLGMHRVYNSAFMNMLKNEENQKYRQAIKDVMHFNPEIMKRYVNFMNNPDEETAVAQFGKDDKYLGVCTMMVTLPGLPMFGHGQIEGFTEKYGMEYRRAYWDEQEDSYLIARHEREIFPLLKKRYLFSHVHNFVLYDFYNNDGSVNENIFAYSNRSGSERALVLYNNKYDRAHGWIKYSSATAQKVDNNFVQLSLREGLALSKQDDFYTIFRDHINGLEYIRSNWELENKGLYAEFDGFKYHVFLDFRQVQDNEYQHYAQLTSYLNGRGVPNIEEALKETFLIPVHDPFRELIHPEFVNYLISTMANTKINRQIEEELLTQFRDKLTPLLGKIKKYSNASGNESKLKDDLSEKFRYMLHINNLSGFFKLSKIRFMSG
jgi:glycosidase